MSEHLQPSQKNHLAFIYKKYILIKYDKKKTFIYLFENKNPIFEKK